MGYIRSNLGVSLRDALPCHFLEPGMGSLNSFPFFAGLLTVHDVRGDLLRLLQREERRGARHGRTRQC